MKFLLMFIGVIIVFLIISQIMIQLIFSVIYEKRVKRHNKYTKISKEKLVREKAEENYSRLNAFDLTNTYRKYLKEDVRKKDLKRAAEIGCRLDLLEEMMLKRGIEIPRH